MSDGKMVHVHLLDQANERALLLERELAQVKAELTASRRLDGLAWRSMRKQRDQALSHLEALAEPPMHLDDVDYPAAVAAARAFVLSMREKADEA